MNSIYQVNVTSGQKTSLPLGNVSHPFALDFDYKNDYIYWIGDGKILQAHRNGTGKRELLDNNITAGGLALDLAGHNIFWTDVGRKTISAARIDGSFQRTLISADLDQPRAVVLQPSNGYMYWTDCGHEPKIERAAMDGSGRTTLVNTHVLKPTGLAIDFQENVLYWCDGGDPNYRLEKSDLLGNNRRVVVSYPNTQFLGVAVDDGNIYWTARNLIKLASETWALTSTQMEMLRVAQRKMERIMLGITLRDRKRNSWIRLQTGVTDIITAVNTAKHRWAGHVARLQDNRWTLRATEWTPREWRRRRGRPCTRTSEANTGLRVAIGSGYGELNSIHLHKDGVVTDVTNACSSSNGGCHHLCLALSGGRTCACRDGWVLQDDESTCSPPDVRLVGGSSHYEGRVEVQRYHQWKTVCDDNWDIDNARVVCRQMGYPDAKEAKIEAYFGQGLGGRDTIGLDEVDCTGNEANLFDCTHRGWGVSDCGHQEDAGVVCQLVRGGSAYQGRVEVLHGGVWGTVCDRGWDLRDADVVCRQLGYPEAATAETGAAFGEGTGPIWVDDATCSGYETSLTKCGHAGWNTSSCDHSQDAGVVCQLLGNVCQLLGNACQLLGNACQLLAVRLVGGSAPSEGRVEVLHQGKWGTVCDDQWDLMDARVVCRRLGYPDAISALPLAHFGEGSGPVWLDDLVCEGNESGLSECGHNGLGVENCEHSEDAGVVCAPSSDSTTVTTAGVVTDSTDMGGGTTGKFKALKIFLPDKQTGTNSSSTTAFIIATTLSAAFALIGVVTLVLSFCVLRRRKAAKEKRLLQRATSNDYKTANPAFCFDDNPVYCTGDENPYDVVRDRPNPRDVIRRRRSTPHGDCREPPTSRDQARDRPTPPDKARDPPTSRDQSRDLPTPPDELRDTPNPAISSGPYQHLQVTGGVDPTAPPKPMESSDLYARPVKQGLTEDEKSNVYVDMSAKSKVYENSVSI
ncbi:Neurotrypsin [Branchiostoma belcheri]|nr:Neurotrypsin [Branchiostoma belcheri]